MKDSLLHHRMKPRILATIRSPLANEEWKKIEHAMADRPRKDQRKMLARWVRGETGAFAAEYAFRYGTMTPEESRHTIDWLVEELNERL